MPASDRTSAPPARDSAAFAWLQGRRQHVVDALDGISDADATRVLVPSGWTMVAVVHHLALDVERFWFRAVMDAQQVDLPPGGAWTVPAGMDRSAVLDLYREEAALADEVLARLPPDAAPRWWPDGGMPIYQRLDQVVQHVVVETATHAGHLDVVRELTDGHLHLVMTD